jgi:hypothetical protein
MKVCAYVAFIVSSRMMAVEKTRVLESHVSNLDGTGMFSIWTCSSMKEKTKEKLLAP